MRDPRVSPSLLLIRVYLCLSVVDLWKNCPRRESNPHDPFESSDFKSDASAIPPRGLGVHLDWSRASRQTRPLIRSKTESINRPFLTMARYSMAATSRLTMNDAIANP